MEAAQTQLLFHITAIIITNLNLTPFAIPSNTAKEASPHKI
jgi:hypothetical protein